MRVAVIGGAGQMGQWFSRFFVQRGDSVTVSGRNRKKLEAMADRLGVGVASDNLDAIRGADLIIVSVLVEGMETVLKEIGPHVTKGQTVIDITSVKESPVGMMHRYIRRGRVLGTHPMFGPSAGPEGQNFVMTPTNGKEAAVARWLSRKLEGAGFNLITMTPRKHDEMIGKMLSLTHFVGLVTADTWRSLHMERHAKTGSTSFNFLLRFAKSVADSNPELYSYLQMSVPTVDHAEDVFVKTAVKWARMVRRRQRASFTKNMKELSEYLDGLEYR